MSELSRRRFLSYSAAAAAAPYIIPASARGAAGRPAPSNRCTIGFVGVKNQGGAHLSNLVAHRDFQILGVCDVDSQIRKTARERVERAYSGQAASGQFKGVEEYNDFRQMIARKDIDTVLVATPDHWHVPIAIAAIKAGKDVYCEKPLTLTVREGRILADAVKRYGRILQTGSQQRSTAKFRYACELVRNGRLGKIKSVYVGLPPQNAPELPPQPEQPVPANLDYNFWLGPAPYEPYNEKRVHYFFRFILDYSGGQVTNFGAHDIDIAQWGLGYDDSGPVEIVGRGFFPKNTFYTTATYIDFDCIYDNGVKVTVQTRSSVVRFEGTDGWVAVTRGSIDSNPKNLITSAIGPNEIHLYRSDNHWQNFLECVRSRRQPVADVEIGHRTATICNLGNIAMQLKRTIKWDPKTERVIGDEEASRMLSRPMRAPWTL